jgi:hypothetical protein
MATINDVVNSQLARVMGNHGAPLRALSEKEAADEALSNRIKLAQMASADETARAMTLLNAREKFSASENEKNRKAQRENIEAQANAYTKRLTAADKQKELARLRALGVELKGDTIDDQIADGLKKQAAGDYPKARGAVGIYKDYEKRISKLDDDISSAEEEDSRYIKSTAASLARQQAAESLKMTMSAKELEAIGNNVTADSIRNAAKIPQKRRAELLQALNDGSVAAQPQMEAMLFSDKLDRPTAAKAKALRNEKLKAETEFMRFQSSEPGRLAVDRMAVERNEKPMTLESMPDDRAPDGIETAKEILGQLNSGATFRPVAGEVRQRDEQLMSEPQVDRQLEQELQARLDRAKSRNQSPEDLRFSEEALARRDAWLAGRMGLKPEQIGASVFNRSPESQAKAMVGSRDPRAMSVIENLPPTERNALYAEMMGRTLFKPVAGNIRMVDEQLMNQAGQIRYGAPSMQEQQALAQMFGSDAPDLMPEVAKLASANGMSQDEQLSTYRAAMSGDPSAVDRMNVILNYVRQSKYSPDFMPVSTPELTAP